MIYTSPDRLQSVFGSQSPFGICTEYLRSLSIAPLEKGEFTLEHGIRVIQKPNDPLKVSGRFEAHRQYIDIQLITRGLELVKAAPVDTAQILEAYNTQYDIEWLASDEEYSFLLKPGRLIVLFPWDIHMPSLMPDAEHTQVDKIIFKVPAALLK